VQNKLNLLQKNVDTASIFLVDKLIDKAAKMTSDEMTGEEMRYQVTMRMTSVHQVIVQARSPEDAEYVAEAIDMEKWRFIEGYTEILDVSPDYFLRPVKE